MIAETNNIRQYILDYVSKSVAEEVTEEFWKEYKPKLKAKILERLEIIAMQMPETGGITYTVRIK